MDEQRARKQGENPDQVCGRRHRPLMQSQATGPWKSLRPVQIHHSVGHPAGRGQMIFLKFYP